jgi:autotransporter-associated beta strand protein
MQPTMKKSPILLLSRATLPLLAACALALPQGLAARPIVDRNIEADLIDGGPMPTSGSLSTEVNVNWTTAPWMITGGPGAYPDGGGTATFLEPINTIIGAAPSLPNITLDVPITLSALTFNNMFQYAIIGSAVNNLTLTGSGTINVVRSPRNTPSFNTVTFGDIITAPIAGSVGLNFIGNNTTLSLQQAANTYTGGTTITNGRLVITGGNGSLGATGAGNDVAISNGQLLFATTAFTTARNFDITGNVRLEPFNAAATINGIIGGSGNLIRVGNSAMTLTGANIYTGTTSNLTGTMTIGGGNGTIASSSGYDLAGTLALDNATANNNDRLSDTAAITSRGATLTMNGNAAATTSEMAGALNLTSGNTTVTVTPNAAQQAALNFASINRLNRSTMFARGTNLGAAAANGVAQITAGNALPLVGGGGAAGSTNVSIAPWAVGNLSATATIGSRHLTQTGSGALRPLGVDEYATDFTGGPDNNVRLTAATAAPSGATANALLFAPAVAATLSGGPINITSGSFLYSPTAAVTGTVSAGLNFGAAEGFIHTSNTLSVSGVISGSNGLTINPFAGSTVTLTGANTYTGATTLNAGQLTFSGLIDPSMAGPLGQTDAPIILNAGSATTRIWVNGTTTFNRDIVVMGPPNASTVTVGLGSTSTNNITINGNVDLQRRLTLENGSTMPMTFNGVISGPGSLTDAFSTLVVLNGTNSYTGGTEISTGTYELGNDSGFGTGPVYFIGAGGTIRGSGTDPRTIANRVQINSAFSATAALNPTFGGTAPLNFTGEMDLNGARRGFNVTNTASTTFSGEVMNGALTKFGTGALSLTRATGNSYTGGTILGASAGTLNLQNISGSATGPGTLSIGGTTPADRSTLSGNFTVAGATSITGTLSPGNGLALNGINDIGTANFQASLSLTGNSQMNFELASSGSWDQVNVGGLLTLAGIINVTTINGYVAENGMSFNLVNWGTLNASNFNIANLNLAGAFTEPGTSWDTSTFLMDGTITVVPEPSTYALLATGLGMLFATARRRMRNRRHQA